MLIVEKHIIDKNHKQWKTIDNLCLLSKNLYNRALFLINEHYEKECKFLRYSKLDKYIRETDKELYCALPNNTSQRIIIKLDQNFLNFFAALRSWKKDKSKFLGCPRPPKYKEKNGRNLLIFTTRQAKIKEGYIHFPKRTGLQPIKTNVKKLCLVEIVPQASCYIVSIMYEKEILDHKLNKDNYLGVDLGINNLATITSNQPGLSPILVNGRILKSINSYYNKKKAKLQSSLEKNHKKKTSNRIKKLALKRNNKIEYYMHHVSKFIVTHCIQNDISNIVIGYNEGWKQEVNMSRKNNQNFTMIPFLKLINQIKYKAKLNSIEVIEMEESYTSKCSALDLESIERHEEYIGKRVKRGLFQYSKGLINADVNGSLNILRKVIGNDFINLVNIGCVSQPVKIDFSQTRAILS